MHEKIHCAIRHCEGLEPATGFKYGRWFSGSLINSNNLGCFCLRRRKVEFFFIGKLFFSFLFWSTLGLELRTYHNPIPLPLEPGLMGEKLKIEVQYFIMSMEIDLAMLHPFLFLRRDFIFFTFSI